MPVDVGSVEVGQGAALVEVAQPFQLLAEFVEVSVVRAGLQKFCDEICCLLIVRGDGLDEVVVKNVKGSGGVAMVADELSSRLSDLGGCLFCGLQAEGGHELVKLGAFDLDLLKVGGVATDGDLCARLREDGQLGEIGED